MTRPTGTTISAKQVSALRARTGAGMMDCKRALEATGGDVEKGVEYLRKKGIARAERRARRTAAEGLIGHYVHFNGKVGVLVEVSCETDFVARTDNFRQLVRDLAMHIASARPLAVTADEVAAAHVERERAIFEAQVAESGKPEHVRAKIVEGKLRKFFSENVLLEQPFVKDEGKTVGELVQEIAGAVGENIVVRRFVRLELGED